VPGEGQNRRRCRGRRASNFPMCWSYPGVIRSSPRRRPFVLRQGTGRHGGVRSARVFPACARDRCCGQLEHGAFAEQAIVNAADAFRLPDGLGFADATALGLVYQTAYFALLDRAGLRAGETVLVGGAAGGVGIASMQLATAFGARVLAAVRKPDQAEFVRAHGADAVIDVGGANLRDDLRAQVLAATYGRGCPK